MRPIKKADAELFEERIFQGAARGGKDSFQIVAFNVSRRRVANEERTDKSEQMNSFGHAVRFFHYIMVSSIFFFAFLFPENENCVLAAR